MVDRNRRDFMKLAGATGLGAALPFGVALGNDRGRFDYIVIGAGSAGCVVAAALSTNPDMRVLVIEAGGTDRIPAIQNPANYSENIQPNSPVNWNFQTVPQAELDNRVIPVPRGKVLGGSSSINAMLYLRGNRLNYDSWQSEGNPGWGYLDVLPYFKAAENNVLGPSPYHGSDGPVSVIDPPWRSAAGEAFTHAAVDYGFQGPNWDFNAATQENGAGFYQLNITRSELRASNSQAFLHPAADVRTNLKIQRNAYVTKLIVKNGKVTGVRFTLNGKKETIRVRREVVVCAGAIQSPQILMLSGIGPADELKALGIEPVVNLPAVGRNLKDHLLVAVDYESLVPLPPYFASGAECGMFVHTNPTTKPTPPDLQFHFWYTLPEDGGTDGHGTFSFSPTLVQPKSTGFITLNPKDLTGKPLIQPRFLSEPGDLQVIAAGIELSRALAAQPAFKGVKGAALSPAATVRTPAEIEAFIRGAARTIYHPVGTCRMGPDPQTAAVDPRLKVYGLDNLRVADASIMPEIINANTNNPTVMIGQRAADFIMKPT